jgi:hypothetical protein
MTRYLVVAHQTADSPELSQHIQQITSNDTEAVFTILVPATPVNHLLVWDDRETDEIAISKARDAQALFERLGANVARISIGDESPLMAIEDEMRAHSDEYDAIVLSTFPPGLSRWLGLDLYNQTAKKFDLPVTHVIADQKAAVSAN